MCEEVYVVCLENWPIKIFESETDDIILHFLLAISYQSGDWREEWEPAVWNVTTLNYVIS